MTTVAKKEESNDSSKLGYKLKTLITTADKTATPIFVKGPAKETRARSFRPSFKLKGSTGTGFAAPKITGDPLKIKRNGRIILIHRSIWGFGLRVSLPIRRAVGSPSLSATYPWATSCKIAEKIRIIRAKIPFELITK